MTEPLLPFELFSPLLPEPLRDPAAWPLMAGVALYDAVDTLITRGKGLAAVAMAALEQQEDLLDPDLHAGLTACLLQVQDALGMAHNLVEIWWQPISSARPRPPHREAPTPEEGV